MQKGFWLCAAAAAAAAAAPPCIYMHTRKGRQRRRLGYRTRRRGGGSARASEQRNRSWNRGAFALARARSTPILFIPPASSLSRSFSLRSTPFSPLARREERTAGLAGVFFFSFRKRQPLIYTVFASLLRAAAVRTGAQALCVYISPFVSLSLSLSSLSFVRARTIYTAPSHKPCRGSEDDS